jgi:cell division ATPase FtsA
VVAASQALAAVTPQAEAIIADIGLSGTDICLIRDNALVAAGSTPFGGAFFTQAIAQALSIDLAEAEKLKRAFVADTLPREKAGQFEVYLDGPRCRWYDAVMDFLVEASRGKPLPRKIYLTGGGSLLPGLDKLLRADPSLFQRAPEVARLGAQVLVTAKDLTQGLDYNLFGLALSLLVGLPD